MQTMLFLKPPEEPGHGWHQYPFYIPTLPDTLCSAWIAIDDSGDQIFDAVDPITGMTNGSHILACGDTHLPFARARFGTLSASLLSPDERRAEASFARTVMGDMDSDMMENMLSDPDADHDEDM